jgi:hypothetical protein
MIPPQLPPITWYRVSSLDCNTVRVNHQTYLHSDTSASLHAPSDICTVPRHSKWNLRVDTDCRQDGASILHSRLCSASKHRKASDGDELEAQHEDASLAHPVCIPASSDSKEAGADIRRYGHQLGIIGGVAHVSSTCQ